MLFSWTFANNCNIFLTSQSFDPVAVVIVPPQTVALYQKLHPYALICVLHATSCKYICERCRSLLWICIGEHGKSHGGRPQVHHGSSAGQQNAVCKWTCSYVDSVLRVISFNTHKLQKVIFLCCQLMTALNGQIIWFTVYFNVPHFASNVEVAQVLGLPCFSSTGAHKLPCLSTCQSSSPVFSFPPHTLKKGEITVYFSWMFSNTNSFLQYI